MKEKTEIMLLLIQVFSLVFRAKPVELRTRTPQRLYIEMPV